MLKGQLTTETLATFFVCISGEYVVFLLLNWHLTKLILILQLDLLLFPTLIVPAELRRARTESQPDNQNQSWSQTGHRAPQGAHGDQGGPPPAKRLKPSPDTQQQLASSTPSTNNLISPPSNSPSPDSRCSLLPNTLTIQTQPSNLSCQNTPPASSSPSRPQLPNTPFSHLQARIGGSGGGTRWSLRQTLGQCSLARRILGKERLAIHLRQRVLSDRGEETELLTYQDNTEDLQVGRADC